MITRADFLIFTTPQKGEDLIFRLLSLRHSFQSLDGFFSVTNEFCFNLRRFFSLAFAQLSNELSVESKSVAQRGERVTPFLSQTTTF